MSASSFETSCNFWVNELLSLFLASFSVINFFSIPANELAEDSKSFSNWDEIFTVWVSLTSSFLLASTSATSLSSASLTFSEECTVFFSISTIWSDWDAIFFWSWTWVSCSVSSSNIILLVFSDALLTSSSSSSTFEVNLIWISFWATSWSAVICCRSW